MEDAKTVVQGVLVASAMVVIISFINWLQAGAVA